LATLYLLNKLLGDMPKYYGKSWSCILLCLNLFKLDYNKLKNKYIETMSLMFKTNNLLANAKLVTITNSPAAGKVSLVSVSGVGIGTGTGYPQNGSNSYLVQNAIGTYYWASLAGVLEVPQSTATSTLGSPVTSALKDGTTRYAVIAVVSADFIQLGYGYLLNRSGTYTWCNSGGTEEATPVSAISVNTGASTARRAGITWFYISILTPPT
jgi:hypothetical protein